MPIPTVTFVCICSHPYEVYPLSHPSLCDTCPSQRVPINFSVQPHRHAIHPLTHPSPHPKDIWLFVWCRTRSASDDVLQSLIYCRFFSEETVSSATIPQNKNLSRTSSDRQRRRAHKTCDTTLNSRSSAADSNLQAKSFQFKYLVSIRNSSQVWWNKFPTITGNNGHLTISCESLNDRFDQTHFRKRSTPVVSRCEYYDIAAVAISCSWRAT